MHTISFGKTVAGTVKNATNGKSIPNTNIYIVELKEGTITILVLGIDFPFVAFFTVPATVFPKDIVCIIDKIKRKRKTIIFMSDS
jgi:hypothetical protein